jgi:hypothetical protein
VVVFDYSGVTFVSTNFVGDNTWASGFIAKKNNLNNGQINVSFTVNNQATGFYGTLTIKNINGGFGGRYFDYQWFVVDGGSGVLPIYSSNGDIIPSRRLPASSQESVSLLQIDRLTPANNIVLRVDIQPYYNILAFDNGTGVARDFGDPYPLPNNPDSGGFTSLFFQVNSNNVNNGNIIMSYTIESTDVGWYGTIKFESTPLTSYRLNIPGYATNQTVNSANNWSLAQGSRLATRQTQLPLLQLVPIFTYAISDASFANTAITSNQNGYNIPYSLYGTTIVYKINATYTGGWYGTIQFVSNPYNNISYKLTIPGYASDVTVNNTTNWELNILYGVAAPTTRLPVLQLVPIGSYSFISGSFASTAIDTNSSGYIIPVSLYGTTIIYNIQNNTLQTPVSADSGWYGTILFNRTPFSIDMYLSITGYDSDVLISDTNSTWNLPIGERLETTSTRLPFISLYPRFNYIITNEYFANTAIETTASGYLIPSSLYGTTIIYNVQVERD